MDFSLFECPFTVLAFNSPLILVNAHHYFLLTCRFYTLTRGDLSMLAPVSSRLPHFFWRDFFFLWEVSDPRWNSSNSCEVPADVHCPSPCTPGVASFSVSSTVIPSCCPWFIFSTVSFSVGWHRGLGSWPSRFRVSFSPPGVRGSPHTERLRPFMAFG